MPFGKGIQARIFLCKLRHNIGKWIRYQVLVSHKFLGSFGPFSLLDFANPANRLIIR